MRLALLFIAALIPAIAEAGYTEYTLLNFTECADLLISTDLPLTYEAGKAEQEAAERRYTGMIERLSKTHDASWSHGLNVIDGGSKGPGSIFRKVGTGGTAKGEQQTTVFKV
ncbi:MAG: hypothetical protein Q8O38_10970 [Sulfurimicrobium sp.]|nr:hypothetical protein [Sulfurimicrobium sp.]